MIWTMMRRELLDSITSLRFYVTSGLVILVMAVGAVIFVGDYQERLGDYNRRVNQNQQKVSDYAKSLSTLGTESQSLYKRPKVLSLCASGEEKDLSNAISVTASQTSDERNVARRNFMLSRFSSLDWAFVIGVVLSFVALLLSYDAVCGEKETGTLRLTSSNPVPKAQILLAKFLGIGTTLLIPFLIGIVLSLIITTSSSDQIALSGTDWTKIGLMVLVSLIYLAAFVTLGFFVSSRTSTSSTSLVLLLFLWVILVVIIPSSGGLIASGFYKLPSLSEIEEQKKAAVQAAYDEYKFKDITSSSSNPRLESNKTWIKWINTMAQARIKIDRDFQRRQFNQTRLARNITRVSPRSVYSYIGEGLAGTGFERHIRFLEDAERYRQQLAEFVKEKDQADEDSAHLYFINWGLSHKDIDPESIPCFVESSLSSEECLQSALPDIALLFLFGVVFFMGAFVSFLRYDVR